MHTAIIATPPAGPIRGNLLLWLLAAAWVAALALGSAHVWRYESTPGAMGLVPSRWPDASRIPLDARHRTLVMLVHPQCSCTRASLDELEDIMTRSQGLVSAWVLLIAPGGSSDGWERSAIADQARRIPGVHVILDSKGAEAVRFGALTSGHVVLYDHAGQLLFTGGITGARGHGGDNVGRLQLLALIHEERRTAAAHAVFGCPL